MSKNFVQNETVRALALTALRFQARSRFWASGPRIFINSIPKAGTHLVTAELRKFDNLRNSYLHIARDRVVRGAGNGERIDVEAFQRFSAMVRPGQYFTAHLEHDGDLAHALRVNGIRSLFVVRDPRDVLVSRYHYVMGLKRHRLHDLFTRRLQNDDDRWRLLIDGFEGPPPMTPLAEMLAAFRGWMSAEGVLTVRFEDLVGARGGGDDARRAATFRRIAEHCGLPTGHIEAIAGAATAATPTLRKGRTGGWRTDLPAPFQRLVAERCAGELAAYGYEMETGGAA
ncbi:MAG: sulfotransferase domain-containing protein [Hyphomicrobiales bacterium]